MPQVAPFFAGLGAGFTGAAGATALTGAAGFGATVGTFLGTTALGTALVTIGANYAIAALFGPSTPKPKISDAYVNVRLEAAPRWLAGGTAATGGAAGIFMEHDEDGNFWYIVAHADSELTDTVAYILDGITVELSDGTDGFTAGDVITDAFCVTSSGEQYEGEGTKVPIWRLYTVTPDVSNTYGALPSAFTTAFSNLPSDFLGVGVCYTIIRGASVKPQKRGAAYRWRGPIGIGEPSVTLVGTYSRGHDPRDVGSDVDDDTTWPDLDGNPAILWAWFRTHPRGKNQPVTRIAWDLVEDAADLCDTTVQDRAGNDIPLYRCGVTFPDNKTRQECEAEILRTMDAFVAYDDEGKAYPVVGYYAAPTLAINRERDILTATTQVVNDGETPLDGVIVEYISPEHGYTRQESAPWVNDTWYDGTSEPRYDRIEVLGCQDHNQAVRLAKAEGLRRQAAQKAAFGTTLKGLLARHQRGIDLSYDTDFTGEYEIATPVEMDGSGQFCRFAVVPLQSDRWTLNEGEEGVPPQLTPALSIDNDIEVASNVVVTAVPIQTSGGKTVRLEVTFDDPSRADRFFRFRYIPTGGGSHEFMTTEMDEGYAYSAIVDDGEEYRVSWQTTTAGGRATVWSDDRDTPVFTDITATANPTAPAALNSANAVAGGGSGEVDYSWVTANDPNQYQVIPYINTASATFGSALPQSPILSGPNDSRNVTQTGISAGTRYFWLVPANGSGVEGTPSGPYTVVIT